MSSFFLIIAIFDLLLLSMLSLRIFFIARSADTGTKILNLYRNTIRSVFSGENIPGSYESLVHLVALHLLVPLTGFAFFLKTDANFLVFIVSVLWSIQLFQRLYPGTVSD